MDLNDSYAIRRMIGANDDDMSAIEDALALHRAYAVQDDEDRNRKAREMSKRIYKAIEADRAAMKAIAEGGEIK